MPQAKDKRRKPDSKDTQSEHWEEYRAKKRALKNIIKDRKLSLKQIRWLVEDLRKMEN